MSMVCPSALGKVRRCGSGPHSCAFAGPIVPADVQACITMAPATFAILVTLSSSGVRDRAIAVPVSVATAGPGQAFLAARLAPVGLDPAACGAGPPFFF